MKFKEWFRIQGKYCETAHNEVEMELAQDVWNAAVRAAAAIIESGIDESTSIIGLCARRNAISEIKEKMLSED